VIGISLDADEFKPWRSETALLFYHHLIEGVLEPAMSSTTGYLKDPTTGKIIPDNYLEDISDIIKPGPLDFKFQGIKDYFDYILPNRKGIEIRDQARIAYKKLAHMILFPEKKYLEALLVPDRSSDFGKKTSVPIVIRNSGRNYCGSCLKRMRSSLWIQAQIVVEFNKCSWIILRITYIFILIKYIKNFFKRSITV